MRIAFIAGFAFSPRGTVRARAHPLATQLVRCGHEVAIFLPPYDNVADSAREWLQDGVRVKNVNVGNSAVTYPRALRSLIQAVSEYRPDLIHVFKPKGFAGAAGTYFLLKRKPRVVVDCDDWEGWGGWNEVKPYPWIVKQYIHWQECWMTRSAAAITVSSRSLQRRAGQVRGVDAGVFYVPNCALLGDSIEEPHIAAQSLSPSDTRRMLGLPEQPLILYSGHFELADRVDFFCRAAVPVAERNQAAFVFVGDGPELAKVRDGLEKYPQVKRYFLPSLPYREFLKVVWASDVTAYPYPDDLLHRSKCSARIIDYMAMGKPVVTSAVGQNAEYIVNGHSGLLSPPGDEEALAKNLELLLRDHELRRQMGENAARRIRANFSWRGDSLQQCLAAYDRVLHT
jgi:glycosyltransferase involved in cell wall biosynthesis